MQSVIHPAQPFCPPFQYESPTLDSSNVSLSHLIPSFSQVQDCYYGTKGRIVGYSETGKKAQALVSKETLNNDDVAVFVEIFKSNEFFKVRHLLVKVLQKQSSEDLNRILKEVFKVHAFDDSPALFKKMKSLMTLQKIEAAVRSEYQGFKGTLDTALQLMPTIQRTVDAKRQNFELTFKNTVKNYILNTLDWFVDSVLFVLQLTDVTDNDANKVEKQLVAQARYTAFRENIAIASAWLIGLALYTGSILQTAIISTTVTLTLITLYALYAKFLKQCPESVHPGQNRTTAASRGLISHVYGRDEMVKKLFDTLEGNMKTRARRYPMIRGGTGIGKSDLGNAMALYLTSPDCPPEWKGKKLFVVSTADIVTGGAHGKMEHLHHIKDVLEGHEDEAILFFTEVHVGFQEKTFFLGQELKTLCDAPGGFPYMVFATTDKEYMEHIAKDPAFARRLDFFDIEPTSAEVTELIISDMVTREASDIFVLKEAIQEVASIQSQLIEIDGKYENVFKDCPQPSTSIAITTKVLANARHPWFKEQEQELQELRNRRDLLDHQLKLDRGVDYLPYSVEGSKLQEQLRKLDEQIAMKEAALFEAKDELLQFRALVKKASSLQEEIENAVLKIKKSLDKKELSEDELKQFILLLNFMKPAMDECLDQLSQRIEKAHIVINRDVMKDWIKQEAVSYVRKKQEKELAAV